VQATAAEAAAKNLTDEVVALPNKAPFFDVPSPLARVSHGPDGGRRTPLPHTSASQARFRSPGRSHHATTAAAGKAAARRHMRHRPAHTKAPHKHVFEQA